MTEREQWETKGCRDGRSEGLGEVAVATDQSEMVSDLDKIAGDRKSTRLNSSH